VEPVVSLISIIETIPMTGRNPDAEVVRLEAERATGASDTEKSLYIPTSQTVSSKRKNVCFL
jgi:hypothetical protein